MKVKAIIALIPVLLLAGVAAALSRRGPRPAAPAAVSHPPRPAPTTAERIDPLLPAYATPSPAHTARAPMEQPVPSPPAQQESFKDVPFDQGGIITAESQHRWYGERTGMVKRYLSLSEDQAQATVAIIRQYLTESEKLRYQLQGRPIPRERVPEVRERMRGIQTDLLDGMRPYLSAAQQKKLQEYFTGGAFDAYIRGLDRRRTRP